jgi:hypothetical protein
MKFQRIRPNVAEIQMKVTIVLRIETGDSMLVLAEMNHLHFVTI